LREALAARSDRDFVATAPSRRGRAAPAEPGLAKRAAAVALRHPLETLIGLVLLCASAAIAWNALAMQKARHPAPLFGPRGGRYELPSPLPPLRPLPASPLASAPGPGGVTTFPSSAPVAVPMPPRPASRDAIGDLIREPTGVRPAMPPSRPAPFAAAAPERPYVPRDPIGDLIRLGEPPPIPPGLVGRPDTNRTVAAGQRALANLGYGVTADGLMGPSTRQAVEQFERDRHLPVTGEFGARTLRELSSQSGVSVD
jgi:Putative peptidoglycan binding domain